MAVLRIEKYRQKDGSDILKVILKPNKTFPDGAYFYADAIDEELVRDYTWYLGSREPYVIASYWDYYMGAQMKRFHREKAYNILDKYPDCINHVNGIKFDNANINLDVVTVQQNLWARPSKGYKIAGRSFEPRIAVNSRDIWAKCVRTEVEAIQSVYQLEVDNENYMYDFLRDRRKDVDLLDMERTGKISEDEAIYHHVLRYAENAWYLYRYNLFEYFKDNNIPIPVYATDSNGFMVHSITGQKLCPL